MNRRLNIMLPEETVKLLDRVTKKGDRSRFIDEAVRRLAASRRQGSLRKQLREGALKRARRDLALAEQWFALEDEAWDDQQ
jgi:CopG family transcriptional regulator/antitoxin EndoAI